MHYSQQVLAGSRSRQHSRAQRGGFTLVEILVVLAIIGILAAILLPVLGSAQERARQASCASNLQQIYTAVKLYYDDEKRYPGSLAVLLPVTAKLSDASGANPPVNGVDCTAGDKNCPNPRGSGHLNSTSGLVCNSDDTVAPKTTMPRSSYGDISVNRAAEAAVAVDAGHHVWNYWGYNDNGFAYNNADVIVNPEQIPTAYATALQTNGDRSFLRDPSRKYDNVVGSSTYNPLDTSRLPRLASRYAPTNTIVTHCVFHRLPTATEIANPNDLYADPIKDAGARDIILRLDGSASNVDVTTFWGNPWVKQIK